MFVSLGVGLEDYYLRLILTILLKLLAMLSFLCAEEDVLIIIIIIIIKLTNLHKE